MRVEKLRSQPVEAELLQRLTLSESLITIPTRRVGNALDMVCYV